MNISKTGILDSPTTDYHYLINNFSISGNTSGWSFGGTSPTLTNGVEILTGPAPGISSSTFIVNPNDIVAFEFTVSVPTPSTTTGGPGLHLGTKYGQSVNIYSYNLSNKTWSISGNAVTNPYFISAYNSPEKITMKTYIFGYNVNLSDFPNAECNISRNPVAIQLTGTDTSTHIRSGYNSNTSMIIHFSNPKIYRLNECGFNEMDTSMKIGKNFV